MERRDILKLFGGAGLGLALPEVQSVASARLEPGDTIVVKCHGCLSQHAAAHLTDRLSAVFPGHRIVLLESGMDLEVLRVKGS